MAFFFFFGGEPPIWCSILARLLLIYLEAVDGIFIHHHDPGFSYLNDTNNEMGFSCQPQVKKATIPGPKDSALNSVADFVIEQGDRIPEEARIQGGNPPEDRGTILETNISPLKVCLKMMFLFPFGGICDRSMDGSQMLFFFVFFLEGGLDNAW